MNKLAIALLAAALPLCASAAEPVLDLISIFRAAQSNDPLWASARSANVAAQEKLVQGKALMLPTASLSANVNHNQSNIQSEPGKFNLFVYNGHDQFETYGYRLDISQPLYRKQNSVQYDQSRTQVAQADEQLKNAQLDLMVRVSQAYFEVLLAQDTIDLIVAQKAAIAKQLEQARANFDVGTSTITDVHEAQARYDLIVAQEILAVNELEAKRRAIQALTGQRPQRLAPGRSDLQAAIPEPAEMEKWVEIASQNNYMLKIQQQALALAEQQVEFAKAGHLPTVDLVGSYSDNRAEGGIAEELRGWNSDVKTGVISVQLAIPLYQGGAISSREREAQANKLKAQDDLEAVRRDVDLQTRQSFLKVATAVAEARAYEQALVSSQSQLDSTQLGYEVGVRTSVDVLNAQQQLFKAKRDLLLARYGWMLAVIKLRAASGTLTEEDLGNTNKLLDPTQASAS